LGVLYKKMEVEDKINTRTDLEEIIMKKEVKDKIDTAAVTVADAIREVEFKLGGKKQIIRKAKTKTQVAETKNVNNQSSVYISNLKIFVNCGRKLPVAPSSGRRDSYPMKAL